MDFLARRAKPHWSREAPRVARSIASTCRSHSWLCAARRAWNRESPIRDAPVSPSTNALPKILVLSGSRNHRSRQESLAGSELAPKPKDTRSRESGRREAFQEHFVGRAGAVFRIAITRALIRHINL